MIYDEADPVAKIATLEAALEETTRQCQHWKRLAEQAGPDRQGRETLLDISHGAAKRTAPPKPAPDAMHSPTEAMLNAAHDWSIEKYGRGIGNDAAIGCWQAMLDAAPVPQTDGARQAFYSVLTKYIPQQSIDQAWQELREAGLVP